MKKKKNERGAGRKACPYDKKLSESFNIRFTVEEKNKIKIKLKETGKTARQVLLESLGL